MMLYVSPQRSNAKAMAYASEGVRRSREPSRLATVVFDRDDDDVDAVVREFVASARREGARVAGFVQKRIEAGCARHDVRLSDIDAGVELVIMQDLGPGATSCRLDSAAIAVAAGRLGRAIETAPDLLVVNRFGKLECEGGGVLAELGEAAVRGLPVVVCVPARFLEASNAFARGLDTQLPPQLADLEAWWSQIARVNA